MVGVQDVVARLNKQKLSIKKKKNVSNIPPLPKNTISYSTQDLPPSPIPSPTSNNRHHSDNHSMESITSVLQKSDTTPPESPHFKNLKKKQSISSFNKTLNEVEDLFQSLIHQNNAAEEYIQVLQLQLEKFAADVTKVRDYEIRVEYLATKLEQVTEERDFYENELNQVIESNQKTITILTEEKQIPIDQPPIIIEEELTKENQSSIDQPPIIIEEELNQETINESDKSIQFAMMQYMTDLEKEKLESKALKRIIQKQDDLILKLEKKINYRVDELLKEQVELQRIELDNKRELLSQLLTEREDLLRRSNGGRYSFRKSSSIDFFPILTRPSSCSSFTSTGRNSPPITAPPKHPLPPVPHS